MCSSLLCVSFKLAPHHGPEKVKTQVYNKLEDLFKQWRILGVTPNSNNCRSGSNTKHHIFFSYNKIPNLIRSESKTMTEHLVLRSGNLVMKWPSRHSIQAIVKWTPRMHHPWGHLSLWAQRGGSTFELPYLFYSSNIIHRRYISSFFFPFFLQPMRRGASDRFIDKEIIIGLSVKHELYSADHLHPFSLSLPIGPNGPYNGIFHFSLQPSLDKTNCTIVQLYYQQFSHARSGSNCSPSLMVVASVCDTRAKVWVGIWM